MITLPAARGRLLDDPRQRRAVVVGRMHAIAVGRFEQQHVGVGAGDGSGRTGRL